MSVLLFGQSKNEKQKSSRSKVIVNGWIHLRISELHSVLIRKIQREIESILASKVKVDHELYDIMREKEKVVTQLLEKLLEIDE